jgi:hypothetical protein
MKVTEKKSDAGTFFRADDSRYTDDIPEKKIVFIVHGLSVKGMKALPCLSEIEQFKTLFNIYMCHLDKFDIFLIPLANPDGFAMTRNSDVSN